MDDIELHNQIEIVARELAQRYLSYKGDITMTISKGKVVVRDANNVVVEEVTL